MITPSAPAFRGQFARFASLFTCRGSGRAENIAKRGFAVFLDCGAFTPLLFFFRKTKAA
jgi:hypothetical protein